VSDTDPPRIGRGGSRSPEAMVSAERYRDPRAMRNAVADRLRPLAHEQGVELSSLQRQFAYDRLLCRVFRAEQDRWVLKGATAMLARLGAGARHTRDIDLLSRAGDLEEAETALRAAVAIDLDDYFTFTLAAGRRIMQGAGAVRLGVVAFLGSSGLRASTSISSPVW
jgi:hypothetical protein